MTHRNAGREAGDGSLVLAITGRQPEELRAAQLAVARSVLRDDRLETDWQREWNLIELLECLDLYRRIQ